MIEQSMNYETACKILNIEDSIELNKQILKKHYFDLCLEHHPDKNASPQSHERFIEIKKAYEFLKNENNWSYSKKEEKEISLFESIMEQLYIVVSNNYLDVSMKIFDSLSQENSMEAFQLLEKYSSLFHLSPSILSQCKEKIQKKMKDNQLLVLNPTLEDITSHNIFILESEKLREFEKNEHSEPKKNENEDNTQNEKNEENEENKQSETIYYIPLWHNDFIIEHETTGEKIHIKNKRQLPENVKIDSDNNLHFYDVCNFSQLLDSETHKIQVGTLTYEFPTRELRVAKQQQLVFKNKGISRINKKDPYDTSDRGHIYYYLSMH